MRLDKFLSEAGVATRSEASRAARRGELSVNGVCVSSAALNIREEEDVVFFRGEQVVYRKNVFVMLNKPEGYVSATEDKNAPVVTSLIDSLDAKRVFPCGRLDKYTLGLMLLTDDGELSHRLLSPARHVAKKYYYRVAQTLSTGDAEKLRTGVYIAGGHFCAAHELETTADREGYITLTEGRYHQIKQMMGAVGNEIIYLERLTFGPLSLDTSLERGEWRYLTKDEVAALYRAAGL